MSQFQLLARRRFLPLFLTQFLGAFNDNVFKNALVILITFRLVTSGDDARLMVIAAGGIFILPFFLFSAVAGQLADKLEKSRLIRQVKLAEIVIMGLGGIGFYLQSVPLLMVILFLMGVQSTMFGPLKYGILPQHLGKEELTGGNAWIQTGTFLAILMGTIAGGILIADSAGVSIELLVTIIALAVLGWHSSRFIPEAKARRPELVINLNILTATKAILSDARRNRSVFLSIIGISWFWFIGATYLSLLPSFTKDILLGDAYVVTMMLTLFSIGIGLGSLACERLSGTISSLTLVPVGALGLSLFSADLYFAVEPHSSAVLHGLQGWLGMPGHVRIVFDMLALSMSGGLYIVPLYVDIQSRSDATSLSRIIAAANVMNALFMVVSALLTSVLFAAGMTLPEMFILVAVMNAVLVSGLFFKRPEYLNSLFHRH